MTVDISRRLVLAGTLAARLTPRDVLAQSAVQPFEVAIPQAKIDDILRRVREARIPRAMQPDDWTTGMDTQWLESLRQHWLEDFDWRAAEAALNRYPQFKAKIEGLDIHFYHVRGEGPSAIPLIMTHGWPGSVREFLDTIDPLTHPSRHGGSSSDAFTVVIPSLPGFAFSEAPPSPVSPRTTARIWHHLMTDILGYRRYAAQGGDFGYSVTLFQALDFPESLLGIHLNFAVVPTPDKATASPIVKSWLADAERFDAAEMDYLRLQMNKTAAVATLLADTPLGAAGWIAEKFWAWSDHDGDLGVVISKDALLTDIMLYLVTDSIDTSLWFYRALRDQLQAQPHPGRRCTVPTAIAQFPKDYPFSRPPRELLDRWYNVQHFSVMPRGGHFAAFEQPDLFINDVRAAFRSMR